MDQGSQTMTKWQNGICRAMTLLMSMLAVFAVLAIGMGSAAAQEVSVGSYVTFGQYPQTAKGNDKTPIEWLVLDVDGDRAFLLSRYALDAKPYNEEHTEITWEECTLRAWLNGEFLNRAFSEKEQAAILLTDVDNSREQSFSNDYVRANSGNDTQDKVFLLSYAEARDYLGLVRLHEDAKIECAPTAYADEQGAYISSVYTTVDGEPAGLWWLRTSSGRRYRASYVGGEESLYFDGDVEFHYLSVRPALWVDLSAGIL